MDNKKLKNLLKETLDLENELYEFCIECLKKIYGENANIAMNHFEEGYNFYDMNGCIQSLRCIDSFVEKVLDGRKERKQKE